MYSENDIMTPRDRISDEMLRRMLGGNGALDAAPSPLPQKRPPQPHNKTTWGLEGYPLASVYAPLQAFQNLYDPDSALRQGTLFAELDLPFMGESVAHKGGACRA